MIDLRFSYVAVLVLALSASGCATPKEQTAPCKRPANLLSYASTGLHECGPASPVNTDRIAALAAIDALQPQAQQGQSGE
ncbi:hypothetical protein ASD64_18500 [Mesorhizobium sp. Root157]|uniref:hypothetical protein n=1 Tax=Mesorhizobium sp. Root157 TaxID=1736477 RepID=UPI0007017089|nr:hypothetical protein [Mesorhizobium sp. Root157]KQZ95895.1 hypothetical protein ASD64_18500 [Mesorhizobium sp. Root157]